MAFLTLKAVQERRAELLDECDALVKVAEDENRESTPDEVAKFESNMTEHDSLGADEERARKYEDAVKAAAKKRLAGTGVTPSVNAGVVVNTERKLPKPYAMPRTDRKLRAFTGDNAGQDEYDCSMWLRAAFGGNVPGCDVAGATQHCRDRGIWADAQTADDGAKGGLLVPAPLSSAVIRIVADRGLASRVCDIVDMDSESLDMSKRTGGLTVYSPAEDTAITTSEMTFGRVSLNVQDRATLAKISNKLLRSAVTSVADRVAEEIGYAFADNMDAEFLLGDGTSTYFGEVGLAGIGAAGIMTGTTTTYDTWAELVMLNFTDTMALLPEKFWNRMPRWICSRAFYTSVMLRLLAAAGGNTVASLEAGASGNPTFLGYPVEFSDKLPTATAVSTIHAYFGNFVDACMIGQRVGVDISASEHRYFDANSIAIRGIIGYDINVHEAGDASNAGAYVALKTGAAS